MINNDFRPGRDFVAIDVEYADREQNICQVGMAIVKNLEIVDSRSWLIQPPCNYYDENYMWKHHVTPDMTENAPTFDQVWQEIQPLLLEGEIWAHNAVSVEQPVLEKNLAQNSMDASWLDIRDSRDLYKRPDCPSGGGNGLEQCCMALGIRFIPEAHHDAQYDAEMCAEIVIACAQGRKPDWTNVPMNSEQLRKSQQAKLVLKPGMFAAHERLQEEQKKAGLVGDKVDLLAELTSTCAGAQPQVVDVFDKGDQMQKDGTDLVDVARLDTSEGNPLRGRVVAMTGAFHISRKEIERALEAMGVQRIDGMTRSTDILIVGNRNVGLPKLAKYEKQTSKGRAVALAVGDDGLDELLYGDGRKFFTAEG